MAALVVLFVSASAFATAAPVCNEHAQSSVAPFPIQPTENGKVRAPCSSRPDFQLGRAPAQRRHRFSTLAFPGGRVLAVGSFALPRDHGQRVPPNLSACDVTRPGHGVGVFRPPCG